MDKDHIVVRRSSLHGPQPVQDRMLALRTAGNDAQNLGEAVTLNHLVTAEGNLVLGSDDKYAVNKGRPLKNTQGMGEDRSPRQEEVLLVDGGPHPLAHAGGRDQGENGHGFSPSRRGGRRHKYGPACAENGAGRAGMS